MQHITLDAISTSDHNFCLETFLALTQYSALKHIIIDIDFDEPITTINFTIPNIPQLILDSTSLTLLVADIVPTSINFGALLLGLPSLQQLSLEIYRTCLEFYQQWPYHFLLIIGVQ